MAIFSVLPFTKKHCIICLLFGSRINFWEATQSKMSGYFFLLEQTGTILIRNESLPALIYPAVSLVVGLIQRFSGKQRKCVWFIFDFHGFSSLSTFMGFLHLLLLFSSFLQYKNGDFSHPKYK